MNLGAVSSGYLTRERRTGEPFEFIVGGQVPDRDAAKRFEDAGVTRMIMSPWRRSREALSGIASFAERIFD